MNPSTVGRARHDDNQARVVSVATELLGEYRSRPIIEVIRAVTCAQRQLLDAGLRQGPSELLAARTRELLGRSPARSAALHNHVRPKGRKS